jgi:hypothetical protein
LKQDFKNSIVKLTSFLPKPVKKRFKKTVVIPFITNITTWKRKKNMIHSDRNVAYLELLKTQQSAHKRNTRLIGVVALFVFLLTLGAGLVRGLPSREVYLLAGLNVVLAKIFH